MIRLKKPLIILTGPTAVGKTKLSVALARAVNGSVISADSMQVYKYMDIGSAKIRPEEMEGIPHYLIDALDPAEEFHVVRFQEMAKAALAEIYGQNRIPIIAGGTGFYIQALLRDIDFAENGEDTSCREALEALAREKGAEALHDMLKECDPKAAQEIHPNNCKRVIRALEYFRQTGEKISSHNEEQRQKPSPYNFAYFVLNDDRARLYARIEQRVDAMLSDGLLDEVRALAARGYTRDMVSMQGLGYKEFLDYLGGTSTYEEAVYLLKRDTRRFAKRQLTWFRRESGVIWLDKPEFGYDEEKILDYMLKICRERGILPAADHSEERT